MPLWMIYPVLFAALYATHFWLLNLPYYWDEAGYYIPAAWDFFHTGTLIPTSTLTNAHPPLPSLYLALWWWADGFLPEVTREAVLMVAAFGLLGLWRLAKRLNPEPRVAVWTVALTALYPIWFAQVTLAHADIFAAAFTLWGLSESLPDRNRRPVLAAMWFSLAALSKETAILIPAVLVLAHLPEIIRPKTAARNKLLVESLWLSASILPLLGWYCYHYAMTGFLFGNPEFLRYNAGANFDFVRISTAFMHRLLHLTAHMNLFVPVLTAIGALFFPVFADKRDGERVFVSGTVLRRIAVLLLANAFLFSILGGALLTRYLLPLYPLILLVCVSVFFRRVRYWQALCVFSAIAFLIALNVNPPYGIAPEDNLTYARFIRLHQHGINYLKAHDDGATVLTAWPASDELRKPELGYVKEPFEVHPIEDFTAGQITRAAGDSMEYSAALVFSTKLDPRTNGIFSLGQKSEARYFGLHHDLSPEEIAKILGGEVAWKEEDGGLWIAVINFDHPVEAKLLLPDAIEAMARAAN